MKELLEYILSRMVENEKVTVSESESENTYVLTIHAPQDEIGKIIGKKGKVINALKQIIKIIAIKEDKRVELQIEES